MAIKVRQEINIICDVITADSEGRVQLDASMYSGSVTFYFEVVAKVAGSTLTVGLWDVGDAGNEVTLSFTETSFTRKRSSSFIPSAGTRTYYVDVSGGTSPEVKSARIIILQDCTSDGDLYYTASYFEVGNDELTTATSQGPMTYPKYWKYESAKWEGNELFYFHWTAEVEDSMYGGYFNLQVDDGSFGGWANVFGSDFAVTSEDPIYVGMFNEDYQFTPIDGRHYRVVVHGENSMGDTMIYNAKVIALVAGVKDEEQVLGTSSLVIAGGSGGSGESDQAHGQSFQMTDTVISAIDIRLYKIGTPTDNVYIEIASTIGGSALATSVSVNGSNLLTTVSSVRFNLPSSLTVTAETTYYFRVLRSGARDTSNSYRVDKSGVNPYSRGVLYSKDNNSWTETTGNDMRFKIYSTGLTKFQTEYLIANAEETSGTGLKDYDTYFNPAEWDDISNSYYHEHYASGASSQTKLQEDPNGTPADITNSNITGANLQRGSAMTMPASAEEIDVNVVAIS